MTLRSNAGASAVSSHMMAFGASGATPKHRMAQVSSGLGLLRDVVVDQHFEQRTRLGRLLAVVAQSPNLLGIGLKPFIKSPMRLLVREHPCKLLRSSGKAQF